MLPPDWQSQPALNSTQVGAVPLSPNVNTLVGAGPNLISGGGRLLTLVADRGSFRVRLGDVVAGMAATTEYPATSIVDGSSGLFLPEGASIVLPAVTITVKGFHATENPVLSFWYS